MSVEGVSIRITPAIRVELVRLAKRGRLTERSIVSASRSPKSPLHSLFYWNDADKAADIGRLEIARQLLLRVKIEPHIAKEMQCSVNVRQYHGTGEGRYLDVRTILADEEQRIRLLDRALRDLEALRLKYECLKELAGIFAAIEQTRGTLPAGAT